MYILFHRPLVCGHTRGNTLYLIRTAKLSPLRHAQYSGGGPRGNRMCCRLFCFAFFFAACPISMYHGVLSSWLKGNSGRCHPWCSVGSSKIQIRTSISYKAHNRFFQKKITKSPARVPRGCDAPVSYHSTRQYTRVLNLVAIWHVKFPCSSARAWTCVCSCCAH